MALVIKCDKVSENTDTGVFTAYYYVIDDTYPTLRLRETTVEGTTVANIETQLQAKFEKYKTKYDREQFLFNMGNAIAQTVMDAVNGGA